MSYSDVAALLAHFPDISAFGSMDHFGNLLTLLPKPLIDTQYEDEWGCIGNSPLQSQISVPAASLTLSLSPIITTNRAAGGGGCGGAYSTPMHTSQNNRDGRRVLMASTQETIDDSVHMIEELGTGLSKLKLGQRPHILPGDDKNANGDNYNTFSCGEHDYGDGDFFDNDNDHIAAPNATQLDNIDEHDIFSTQFYNHNYGDKIKTALLPTKTMSPVMMRMHPPLGSISSTSSSSSSSSSSSLVGPSGLNFYRNAASLNLGGTIRIQAAQTTSASPNDNTNNHRTCNNSINSSRSQMKLWSWLNEHFNSRGRGILVESHENRLDINKALISYYMSTILQKSQGKKNSCNPNYESQRGRMLIVCHKVNVEHFANIARSFITAKLLVYTESFEKRKKMDSARLSQYHIVITTFDVLKVKEVRMHKSYDAHLDALDEVDAGIGNDGWMSTRHADGGEYFEVSNLHLLKWDMCIIDHGSQVTTAKSENLAVVRSNTIKGNAVKRLKCTEVISLAVIRTIMNNHHNNKSDNIIELEDMSGKRKTRFDLDNKSHANNYDESNCCDISDITDENTRRPFSDNIRLHRVVKPSAKIDCKLSNAVINSIGSIMNLPSGLVVSKICLDLSDDIF